MNRLLVALFLVFSTCACFAEQVQANTILKFMYYDDFKTWLGGGKSLYNYSKFVDKSKVISNQVYSPHIMYHEFDSNVYAAYKKYNSSPQKLNGIVYSVKSDRSNDPIVTFTAGSGDYFYAKGFDVDEVSNLKRGYQFQFICYKFNYDGFILRSDQCTTTNKYLDLVSLGLFKDININSLQDDSTIIAKNMIDDFANKDEMKKFNLTCDAKPFNDKECLDWSKNIFKELMTKTANKASLVAACYKENPLCPEAISFSKRYKVDFEKLKKEKEESDLQKKKLEKQKVINNIKSFLSR
ncbi:MULTISPECIES: hypothetical protein [Acinetobacter]|uniref:Uncharacterized protein n=1 Tax=Acinetobacter genomosp. 33YU TaxID=1675530 RepID=A0A1V2UNJ3_9GAMM|nr:hypothetical protein [Acinetobacter genomosp. 33YU]ONN48988.1 hypothetical protein AC058_20245 [Acinetobacter genomosp. 33YU]